MDWQFYPAMNESTSLVYDPEMPEFRPLMELIPSFKLIRFKSVLSEFAVGRGRIIMCGLKLTADDPAAQFLKAQLLAYLDAGDFTDAPVWQADDLKKRLSEPPRTGRREIAIDAGGRPLW